MSEKRFGGFVPTFRRSAILKKTIQLIFEQTVPPDVLLVVDNAGSEESRKVATSFPAERVIYVAAPENLGSAGGTAYGVQWLYDHGYDYIYCGDDDDPPKTPDTIERILAILASSDPDVGGVGAVGALWDWKKGELSRFRDSALKGVMQVDVIGGNQHLILKREGVQVFGAPNPNLFFGYPDVEYSLRIQKAGYKLLIDGDLMRIYRDKTNRLNLNLKKALLPRRKYASMWRNYYTTRNYIHMMRKTFDRPDLAARESLKALSRIPLSWLRGPKYGSSFSRLQLRALWDAYFDHMGRTVAPGDK